MTAGESWCLVPVDDEPSQALIDGPRSGLHLIYGPRLGRLYLLPGERARDRALQRMLGLRAACQRDALADPVERIVCDEAALSEYPLADSSGALRLAYRALHRSRRYLPFRAASALVQQAARRARPRGAPALDAIDASHGAGTANASDASDTADLCRIGRRVRDLEHQLGLADCYPRALVTAYLCLLAGRRCTLTIGVLAPTRKMHAWCSVQASLPYEPLPEHYLYRPLWSNTLAP